MDFNTIVVWSNMSANFSPLPIEETLNESQMNLTVTATPKVRVKFFTRVSLSVFEQ